MYLVIFRRRDNNKNISLFNIISCNSFNSSVLEIKNKIRISMRRLILDLAEFVAIKVLKFSPKYIVKKYIRFIFDGEKDKKKEKLVLDSMTVLKDDKALLTYKKGDLYFTKTINYRVGEIKPIKVVVTYE